MFAVSKTNECMIELTDEAVRQVRSMVLSNDSRVFRFLRIYMLDTRNNILHVLDAKNLLTKPVVFTAWETGRVDILSNCLRHKVDINAPSSVSSAIRSASTATIDFCVEQGGSVVRMQRPYCHCTTVETMEYLWDKYGCKLYERENVFPRDFNISIKFMEMGGTVAQLGKKLNKLCHEEGNWRRSLPVKRAYMEQNHPYSSTLATLLLALPKSIVNSICEYM